MRTDEPNFTPSEYARRIRKTRDAMAAAGVDLLITVDPSNMNWLTGYDGWSFYTPQAALLTLDGAPLWWGRGMDMNGALRTVHMPDECVLSYPDHYVMSTERHPVEHLAELIAERNLGGKSIGVEMDNYYFSAASFDVLRSGLSDVTFKDATGLVNWQRAVKSDQELTYMKRAGRIVEEMHKTIFERIAPGLKKNELVAEIYRTAMRGADGHGGDYPAIAPMVPSGADASAAHLTWNDLPFRSGEGTFFEIAGCHRRYHCPLCRTVYLGKPPKKFLDAELAIQEGMAAGLEVARAGNVAEDIVVAFNAVVNKYGFYKETRMGYPIGVSYPPDWGERTISFRMGDRSELKENMTFHFMTALWQDDWGFEITESFIVRDGGPELLAHYPRKLFVKE